MQRNTLFSILATAALGLVMAGPVNAGTTHRWIGNGSAEYHTDENWNPNGVPGTGDTANITPLFTPAGYMNPVLDDQDRLLGKLVIGSGYSLTITGVKLSLDLEVTHDIDGNLFLSNNLSKLEFKTYDATVGGDGAIVGQDNSAQIRIADDKRLTNEMVISGKMTILDAGSSGKFVNGSTGIVLANAGGILLMDDTLELDDVASAQWKATTNSSTFLQFESGLAFVNSNPELKGKFVLCGDANLDFDVQVRTSGCFDEANSNGWVLVAGTDYFCYDDDDCGGASTDGNCWSSDHEFTGSCP